MTEIVARVQQQCSNLTPTTYEASKLYLDQELKKPKGQRDLTREMCMLTVLKIPEGHKIYFRADSTKLLIPLTGGKI
jgi:hypothetical protein